MSQSPVSPVAPMALRLMATAWDVAKSCDPLSQSEGRWTFSWGHAGVRHQQRPTAPSPSLRLFLGICIWAPPYEDFFFFFFGKQPQRQTMGGLSTFSWRLSLLSLRGHEGSKTSGRFILSMKQMAGKWRINQRRY